MGETVKSISEKYNTLLKKFSEENKLRQQESARNQAEREHKIPVEERFSHFEAILTARQSEIEERLNDLASSSDVLDDQTKSTHFDAMAEKLKTLRKNFASSTRFLKPYEVRMVQKTIQDLEKRYDCLKRVVLPRKKFTFTSASKCRRENKGQSSSAIDKPKPGCSRKPKQDNYSAGFSNTKEETLVLEGDEIHMKDVCLSELEDCTIQLKGALGLLTVASLHNCKVYSGPVATSAFLQDCRGCEFFLAAQQLRVHDTSACDFHVHVSSRAIIEDTTDVRFGPYEWTYDGLREHFRAAGLDIHTNHWNSVDDFNWLANDKPSPNWTRLSEVKSDTGSINKS